MNQGCLKCHGTGIVKDEKGVHTCWDCLNQGELDAHSKRLPENNLKKLFKK
jgi:DnaJ-class molecular chaperone